MLKSSYTTYNGRVLLWCSGLTQEGNRLGHHAPVNWPHLDGRHIINLAAEGRAWDGLTTIGYMDAVFSSTPWCELYAEGVVTVVPDLGRHRKSTGAYSDAAKLVGH